MVNSAIRNIQAERIRSALTSAAFTLHGARSYFIFLDSGTGVLETQEETIPIGAHSVIWTPPSHSVSLRVDAGSRGGLLRIPETLLGRALPRGATATYVRHAIANRMVLPAVEAARLAKLRALFEEVEQELYTNSAGAETVVEYCLSLLLIQIWRSSNPSPVRQDLLPRQIVHDFFSLVELYMHSHWPISRYAEQLGVSKDRLNAAVRRSIGNTPHGYIQDRLIEETKKLLINSDLQVAEIAYRLGFNDAAYFNRFFQRHVKTTPGRFRNDVLADESRTLRRETFSAWP